MQQATDRQFVLVVEDDEDFLWSISQILKNYAEVLQARNPLEAFKILKERSVDLVVTDINMPEMSGVEFIKELKKRDYNFPIFVVSASISSEVRISLHGYDVKWLFEKPLRAEQFRTAVRVFFKNNS